MDSFPKPMYSMYGIGFNRDLLITEHNARPVIYGSIDEKQHIDSKLHWRFEMLNIETHDFTWLREWRIKGNSFNFSDVSRDFIIIITPDETIENYIQEYYSREYEEENYYTGVSCSCEAEVPFRIWKGLGISQILEHNNDYSISKEVAHQEILEDLI